MIALDIHMPNACTNCPFYDEYFNTCIVKNKQCSNMPDPTKKKEDWCPILPVDRLRFRHEVHDIGERYYYTMEYFKNHAAKEIGKLIAESDELMVAQESYMTNAPIFTAEALMVHPCKEEKDGGD